MTATAAALATTCARPIRTLLTRQEVGARRPFYRYTPDTACVTSPAAMWFTNWPARAPATNPSNPTPPARSSTALPTPQPVQLPISQTTHAMYNPKGDMHAAARLNQTWVTLHPPAPAIPPHTLHASHLAGRNVPHKLPRQSSRHQRWRACITCATQHSPAAPTAVELPICCCSKGMFPSSGNSYNCLVLQRPEHTAGLMRWPCRSTAQQYTHHRSLPNNPATAVCSDSASTLRASRLQQSQHT
jgi:hypothetical protein